MFLLEVNLLPLELRKKKKTPAVDVDFDFSQLPFKKIIIIAVIVAILVQGGVSWGLKVATEKKLAMADAVAQLSSVEKQYQALKTSADIAEKKMMAFHQLYQQRIVWSELLNEISNSLIAGVWLTELNVINQGVRKTPQPERRQDELYLILSGYATSTLEEQTAVVGNFIQALKADKNFADHFFDVKLVSLTRKKIEGQDVVQFRVSCEFK